MTAALNPPVCVKPIQITDALLIATDVPEADYPAIANSTVYVMGDRVISTVTHMIYQCELGYTSGSPATPPNLDETHWTPVAATNRWKMFDAVNSSQTAQADSVSYTLELGESVSTLGVLNLTNATSVRARLVDPTYGTVYDKTVDVSAVVSSSGWWEWVFGLRSAPVDCVFTDLPSYPTAQLVIDIEGGADLAVGVVLVGQAVPIGYATNLGIRVGIQDYSKVKENAFGDTVLVQRAFAKRATFSTAVLRQDVDSVVAFLTSVRATPCLYVGSISYQSTFIFGFYQDMSAAITYTTHSELSLQVRGLT